MVGGGGSRIQWSELGTALERDQLCKLQSALCMMRVKMALAKPCLFMLTTVAEECYRCLECAAAWDLGAC